MKLDSKPVLVVADLWKDFSFACPPAGEPWGIFGMLLYTASRLSVPTIRIRQEYTQNQFSLTQNLDWCPNYIIPNKLSRVENNNFCWRWKTISWANTNNLEPNALQEPHIFSLHNTSFGCRCSERHYEGRRSCPFFTCILCSPSLSSRYLIFPSTKI